MEALLFIISILAFLMVSLGYFLMWKGYMVKGQMIVSAGGVVALALISIIVTA